jgi:hypothetical protein
MPLDANRSTFCVATSDSPWNPIVNNPLSVHLMNYSQHLLGPITYHTGNTNSITHL